METQNEETAEPLADDSTVPQGGELGNILANDSMEDETNIGGRPKEPADIPLTDDPIATFNINDGDILEQIKSNYQDAINGLLELKADHQANIRYYQRRIRSNEILGQEDARRYDAQQHKMRLVCALIASKTEAFWKLNKVQPVAKAAEAEQNVFTFLPQHQPQG